MEKKRIVWQEQKRQEQPFYPFRFLQSCLFDACSVSTFKGEMTSFLMESSVVLWYLSDIWTGGSVEFRETNYLGFDNGRSIVTSIATEVRHLDKAQ